MTAHGEVQFKVKRAILFLRHFTIPQLASFTGLKAQTVERTVHHFVERGFLMKSPSPTALRTGPGQPPKLYTLTNERAKIDELRAAVKAFQEAHEPGTPAFRLPQNPYNDEIVSEIDELEQSLHPSPPFQIEELRRTLNVSRRYEVMLDDGTDEATPYLDVTQGRLEVLAGRVEEGCQLIQRARAAFELANMSDQVRMAEEQLAAIEVREASRRLAGQAGTEMISDALKSVEKALELITQSVRLRAALNQMFEQVVAHVPSIISEGRRHADASRANIIPFASRIEEMPAGIFNYVSGAGNYVSGASGFGGWEPRLQFTGHEQRNRPRPFGNSVTVNSLTVGPAPHVIDGEAIITASAAGPQLEAGAYERVLFSPAVEAP